MALETGICQGNGAESSDRVCLMHVIASNPAILEELDKEASVGQAFLQERDLKKYDVQRYIGLE